jgi:hypothetical protein
MNNWQKILFSFGIAAPIIIEGLGLPLNRAISYYFILIAPFILFALANAHRTLNIPLWSAILYLSFLIFSIVGTFFSLNVQVSFEYVLLYTAYFLIFIYSYNNPWISRVIPQVIAFITIIFILYAAYFYVAFPNNLTISPFIEGYNLIAAKYRGHNQLADFLVLPLAIGFYFLFHKKHTKLAIGAIVVLLPPFIFSYSRSAYAALG